MGRPGGSCHRPPEFVLGVSWIHPASRMPMESEWSLLMLMGPERARFTQARVMGSRLEAATYIISYIKARRPRRWRLPPGPRRPRRRCRRTESCAPTPRGQTRCSLPRWPRTGQSTGESPWRGDGEGRHHVGVNLLHGKGDGLVAGEALVVVHGCPSLLHGDGPGRADLGADAAALAVHVIDVSQFAVLDGQGNCPGSRARTAGSGGTWLCPARGVSVRQAPVFTYRAVAGS